MCSTCNYKNFEIVNINGQPFLEQQLGTGNLLIRCNTIGKNYKLAIKDDPKSEFVLYRCPTCGAKLY